MHVNWSTINVAILIGFIYNKYFKKQVEYKNKYALVETYSNEYK